MIARLEGKLEKATSEFILEKMNAIDARFVYGLRPHWTDLEEK